MNLQYIYLANLIKIVVKVIVYHTDCLGCGVVVSGEGGGDGIITTLGKHQHQFCKIKILYRRVGEA